MLGGALHAPPHEVPHHNRLPSIVDAQPDGGTPALALEFRPLFGREVPAAARIPIGLFRRPGALPLSLQFLGRAVAVVRRPPVLQGLRILPVQVRPFGLAVRPDRTAHIGSLLPIEPEPVKVFPDRPLVLLSRPGAVGVLDAEDERSRLAARKEPVEEGKPRAAAMEVSGGTGSVAGADRHVKSMLTD